MYTSLANVLHYVMFILVAVANKYNRYITWTPMAEGYTRTAALCGHLWIGKTAGCTQLQQRTLYTLWRIKTGLQYFCSKFVKCAPDVMILSLQKHRKEVTENVAVLYRPSHLRYVVEYIIKLATFRSLVMPLGLWSVQRNKSKLSVEWPN